MGKGINPVLQKGLDAIKAGNREWMNMVATDETGRLKQLAEGQHPEILWIGCSDSRVPANQITGTLPGEVFVHRNIANICAHSDMNMLSVLDYAVNVLRVKHIIVAGHYGCGGVEAALSRRQHGIIDNWLSHIKDVYRLHRDEIETIRGKKQRLDRMVELNVAEQVFNLCTTSIIQNAWSERHDLAVHGMVIVTGTGELVELGITFTGPEDLGKVFSFRKSK